MQALPFFSLMDSIIRSIKKISTGLIFTMDKELISNAIYTSYSGMFKNKKCTIFKYKGSYSTIAEESYPLLKYVQDLLYIVPEILAHQKHNSSFYIITDRILPIAKQKEASNAKEYEVFNEFMSTNISHINSTLLRKHSIILTSLNNLTAYSSISMSSGSDSLPVSALEDSRNQARSISRSECMAASINIDYSDIYYDCNNNTKVMVLPIFTTENNIVYNPSNTIYKIHKVLQTDDYCKLHGSLINHIKLLPPHYSRYIINALFSYIEKNKIKTSEVQETIDKCEKNSALKRPSSSRGASNQNINEKLVYVIRALMLFDVFPYYELLGSYPNPSPISYIVLYQIEKNLYSLPITDINGVFYHINSSITKYTGSKAFENLVIEILFSSLHVLSSSNRMLFVEMFIKQDSITERSRTHIKNTLSVLMNVENIYNLLMHLLSSKCLASYRLGVFILYNNIDRIGMESLLLQVIEVVGKKCLKDEVTNESVQLLKYIVDYINNNVSEIKKSRGVKIAKQKAPRKKEIEEEWTKRNQMHISKIANKAYPPEKNEDAKVLHSEWANSEW